MKEAQYADAAGSEAVRLDIWLWAARFFKTRSLAKQAVEGGKIEVNGAAGKPAKAVHAGDVLKIVRGEERFELRITALSGQRGPASAARTLYEESEASLAARREAAELRRLQGAGYAKPPTKPDKRARRLIRALGDIDAL
ncbi:RNA-binding S4 domain-containing protein [Dokdonella ginsengisoli]|uniref:Heat shock protein 15 n=1 Tax=Dokdonella ginsengisoli TaxID=363846 RepID=A0ABV9QXV5_9GAMM